MVSQFEDAGTEFAHGADEGVDLVAGREPAGDRTVVGGFVVHRDRRGEADRSSTKRGLHSRGHQREIIGVGFLGKGPFAHGPGAQGRVADVAGVVDALGRAVDEVQVLGKRLPRPVDARGHGLGRDVLGPLEVADDQLMCVGADGREREAAVAHDHGGDAMEARALAQRVPEIWASMWVWTSMNPGVTM